MKNFNSFGLIAAVIVLSACGSQSTNSLLQSSGNGTQTGNNTVVDNSGNTYNLPAAPEQRIEMSGTNGSDPTKTLSFSTSKTLKVRITPLNAPNITTAGYTNWVFPYGCLQVTVSVNGITKSTSVLKVNGTSSTQCQSSATSEVLDFTSQMTGNGNVSITVQNANYDNCRYSWPMYYGCYMSQVWQSHRVAMNVQVQTDGTWMSAN